MQASPRLLVGLGNPGIDYEKTRHNAGFWLCERLATRLGVRFQNEARFHGQIAHARGEGIWLLMPQTYMNHSGQAVGEFARFYRIAPTEILVIHDELDLPPGGVRLKHGGGTGGHNGIKDIAAHMGSHDFWRLRIGIGHPGNRGDVAHFVLKPPLAEEKLAIDEVLDRALSVWPLLQGGDWMAAMQRLNQKAPPPQPGGERQGKGFHRRNHES